MYRYGCKYIQLSYPTFCNICRAVYWMLCFYHGCVISWTCMYRTQVKTIEHNVKLLILRLCLTQIVSKKFESWKCHCAKINMPVFMCCRGDSFKWVW